jgi:hypothetical protein
LVKEPLCLFAEKFAPTSGNPALDVRERGSHSAGLKMELETTGSHGDYNAPAMRKINRPFWGYFCREPTPKNIASDTLFFLVTSTKYYMMNVEGRVRELIRAKER